MIELLTLTINAHGGLDRWKNLNQISSRIIVGGIIWDAKMQAGILDDVYVTVDTKRQYTSHYPFVNQDWHTSFQPKPGCNRERQRTGS